MKKFVAMLLVLTMVLALAGAAMADCCTAKAGMWVEFTKDSNAYTAAKSSKKTENVVQKGSFAMCDKTCGKYARVIVNEADGIKRWFKICDLKESEFEFTWIVWAKGGKGMSTCLKNSIEDSPWKAYKGWKVKVINHTNLRKNPGLKFKSQGVVEKCDMLKITGRWGMDNRKQGYNWLEVCQKGKKLWISMNFIEFKGDSPAFYK